MLASITCLGDAALLLSSKAMVTKSGLYLIRQRRFSGEVFPLIARVASRTFPAKSISDYGVNVPMWICIAIYVDIFTYYKQLITLEGKLEESRE